jgi:flagellar hook assembly protein FlgD
MIEAIGQTGADLRLDIVDVRGSIVRTLIRGGEGRLRISWDGRDAGGHSLPAGTYFARLTQSGHPAAATKLVLVP